LSDFAYASQYDDVARRQNPGRAGFRFRAYDRWVSEAVTAREFHATEGLGDWRVLFNGASAHFRTAGFSMGVGLVDAVGRIAGGDVLPPDVDLRAEGVTVVLPTSPLAGLTRQHVVAAREISAAASAIGATADIAQLQFIQVTIDALETRRVLPFWRAVLGYDQVGDEDLLDPQRRGPSLWFQPMAATRDQRNRIHVDLSVPFEQAASRIEAAVAAGGRIVFDAHAPMWWTLADPEGNEVDIATMEGRD
jgi:4a-hydroxytetrahydrobiopterin dehydratase